MLCSGLENTILCYILILFAFEPMLGLGRGPYRSLKASQMALQMLGPKLPSAARLCITPSDSDTSGQEGEG